MGTLTSIRQRHIRNDIECEETLALQDAEEDNRDRLTLLSHQYHIVCPCAVVIYVILQYLIGTKSNLGSVDTELSERVYYFYNGAGFSFIISAVQQVVRILECRLQWGSKSSQGIYFTVFTVSSIAASSFILTFTMQWGGVCKDVLGVESAAAQWAEWLVTVPLMVYMTLAMEDKDALTVHDIIIIVVFTLAISFGFLMNFRDMPKAVGYVMFVLGCCSITVTVVLERMSGIKFIAAINDHNTSHADYRRVLIKASKRRTLSRLFLAVFPLFPLTHILSQVKVLDRDNTFIAYALCSLIAKLLFASSVSDAHMSLAEGVNNLRLSAELTANERRRNFLRYVFHEVRVPLNTISMGLIVVKEDHIHLSDSSKEAVAMMNGATNFMSDTLNDVLSMQKIEDGKMELILKPFSMASLIKAATTAVKGSADEKKITMSVESELDIPLERGSYVGDRFRLEHVIVNFLSNAIKFSPEGSQVTLKLTGKANNLRKGALPRSEEVGAISKVAHVLSGAFRNICFSSAEVSPAAMEIKSGSKVGQEPPTMCYVTLLVIDEGTGIAKKDLDRLFMPYCQIQPDMQQQGKGTGLGLVLAKEIVGLHGGRVVVKSELGRGSAFGFCIPFELIDNVSARSASTKMISLCTGQQSYQLKRMPSADSLNGNETRAAIGSNGNNENVSSPTTIPYSLSFEEPSDMVRAETLTMQRADEKVANLKAGRTFLIVDDTPSNSRMLAMVLMGRGIACEIASNGQEAIDLVTRKGDIFDLIFMDHFMPVMSGIDATRAIRSSGFERLIFGLTGDALDEDVRGFLEAGADCVLGKPLRQAEMDAILQHTEDNGFLSEINIKFNISAGRSMLACPFPRRDI